MRGNLLSYMCSFSILISMHGSVMAADLPTSVSSTSTTSSTASSAATATSTPATTSASALASPASSAPASPAASAPASAHASAPTPARATVDPEAIKEQLHDLVDTLKKVYNAAQNLQSECNRVYNADALDNVIMDPWMEGQPGLAHVLPPPFPGALKPLPARKKWVDYDQNQLTQLLRMLTNEVNAIGGASSIDSSIKVTVEILQDNLQQVDEQYERLNALTNPTTLDSKGEPVYDKAGITKTAQALKDETSGMNEIRKRLLRQLKSRN